MNDYYESHDNRLIRYDGDRVEACRDRIEGLGGEYIIIHGDEDGDQEEEDGSKHH